MASVRIEVLNGGAVGTLVEPAGDVIRLGRAPHNEVVLPDAHVSAEHARLVVSGNDVVLEDLRSTNGTAVVRGTTRIQLDERGEARTPVLSEDRIELGGQGDECTALRVTVENDHEPEHVISVRPIQDLRGATQNAQRNSQLLDELSRVQRAIAAAEDLASVVDAVADAALELLPRATHASVVLRDELGDAHHPLSGYVPITTRIRGPQGTPTAPLGPVPITRSIFRKVVSERAAVLAADASLESFSSESLLGTNIRSTIGVPLWRGQEVLGVLQVDNRGTPRMFDAMDLDVLAVLAQSASLAVDNARLIRRLVAAEEQLRKENSYLRGRERARQEPTEIIGQSRAMRELFSQLDKVVNTRVTVLVEGETGVGKELVASALHYRSRRSDRLFVAQNCAAMPENLLESELFGHKRGAFTGASEDKRGLFEVADGGTLFLDEVTELPLTLQAKLLRVLQEGEIRPLGATSSKRVTVRIVAATNKKLEQEVEQGRFREDLYYRLKVFPLQVPPLRERREDIPLLAAHFLAKYTRELGKSIAGYSQEAMELLVAHDWPGNVRELENEVQRAVIQTDLEGFIGVEAISPRVRRLENMLGQAGAPKGGTLKDMMDQVERHLVLTALRDHGNNKTSAAKTLGITREGLHKKLRQLKIS